MNSPFNADTALSIYRTMVRIGDTDKRIQQGLAAGALQFQYYPAGGQEAIPAAIAAVLEPSDQSVITYRCIHDIVAKGTPIAEIMAEMYGKSTGTSKGKGGPMHLSDPDSGLMVTTGIVGAGAPIATGLALAAMLKKTGQVTICNFGDGAANIGAVHEALNLAALWKLPLIFVCQNNLYAEYTSFAESTASTDIAGRAAGYGMTGEKVDGCNPQAVFEAAGRAVARARAGKGPTLLECVAHRLQGHSYGSDESHMDAELLDRARADAPLITFRRHLIDSGIADEAALAAIEAAAASEVDSAQKFAETSQPASPSELYIDVFADHLDIPDFEREAMIEPAPQKGRKLTYGQAINEAQDQALAADPRVILLGEDIADPSGGIVKATYGLSTKHGTDRVRGTPISEQAIVGAAIGSALGGMRPVAEIMITDFAMVCMDQIANHAAKLRYMSGGRTSVPLVLRMLTAGKMGSFGAQHSQSLEAWFAHIPGLKIVAPSNAYDAKGMLLAAIDDPDPVIVLEAMRCYFVPGEVPEAAYRVPLGVAKTVRTGSNITIISYSWMMQDAIAAAATLSELGIDAEVIDLRSLVPLDMAALEASVGKTGRALIIHAAVEFCGFGAELSARLQERLWGKLKAPVGRVGGRYTPVPFAQSLESMHFPNAASIVAKAQTLMGAH